MSRAGGGKQRAVKARKAERERIRDERKQAKQQKRTGAAAPVGPAYRAGYKG